jgi:hypothetical protein
MARLIKILHIDPDYRITYFILRSRLTIRTSVPLQSAIELLKKEDFDLIVSEPHNKAILKEQPPYLKLLIQKSNERERLIKYETGCHYYR